ncbi:hypothetical protein Fmac_007489 [Flemingia macrophylla]|uniref:Uncharacterized protein n=1 Tax=Flemingia macrophylla TaxID=520843 RepID=A0ABD1MUS0_9FABA
MAVRAAPRRGSLSGKTQKIIEEAPTIRHNNLSRTTDKSTFSLLHQNFQNPKNTMMMSMFSHFDIAQGQKWSFSLGTGLVKGANSKPKTEGTSSSESKAPRKDSNPSSPDGPKQNPTPLKPRFAPEFDGLHCFESIVPC